MLDVVKGVVHARDTVVERLFRAIADIARDFAEHARRLGVLLLTLADELEEIVYVHALVDVQKEGNSLGWVQSFYIHLLELADCLDEGLVLGTINGDLDIQHLVVIFIRHDGRGIHLFNQLDQIRGYLVGITRLFTPRSDQIVSTVAAEELEAVKIV